MATTQRREIHSQPKAKLVLFETQPPLTPDGITIERYYTARGLVIFEKHIAPNGVEHWFKVEKGASSV